MIPSSESRDKDQCFSFKNTFFFLSWILKIAPNDPKILTQLCSDFSFLSEQMQQYSVIVLLSLSFSYISWRE